MKKILCWLHLSLIAILSSCDKSEEPYTGPWEISYYEDYYGIHNDSKEFESWFESHNQFLVTAMLGNGSQWWDKASSSGKMPTLDDYNKWRKGGLHWIEIVDNAPEETIKSMVESFEAMTIEDKANRHSDKFSATYGKYRYD